MLSHLMRACGIQPSRVSLCLSGWIACSCSLPRLRHSPLSRELISSQCWQGLHVSRATILLTMQLISWHPAAVSRSVASSELQAAG